MKLYEIYFPGATYSGGMGGDITSPRRKLGIGMGSDYFRAILHWASLMATTLELNDFEFKDFQGYLNGSQLEAVELPSLLPKDMFERKVVLDEG